MNRQTICSSIAALACGCIGSATPVVDEGGTGYDPRLLGTWGESASVERAVITQRGPRSYSI